jgi:hypothetical protein
VRRILPLFPIWLLGALAGFAQAHGLPDGVIERGVQIDISPETVLVQYRIGLTPHTLHEELTRLGEADSGDAPDQNDDALYRRYARAIEPLLLKDLRLTVGESTLILNVMAVRTLSDHHARIEILLGASLPMRLEPGREYELRFRDSHFPNTGFLLVGVRGRDGVEVVDSDAPAVTIRAPRRDLERLSAVEAADLRETKARFRLVPFRVDSFYPPMVGILLISLSVLVVAHFLGKTPP